MNKKVLALSLSVVAVVALIFGVTFAKGNQKKTQTDASAPTVSAGDVIDTAGATALPDSSSESANEEVTVLPTEGVTASDVSATSYASVTSDIPSTSDVSDTSSAPAASDVSATSAANTAAVSTTASAVAIPSADVSAPTDSKNKITREQALNIALKDAGLSEADVWDKDIELDFEKNTLVYEVSFEKNETHYNYIINAKSGEILHSRNSVPRSSEKTPTKAQQKSTRSEPVITREQALGIALKAAGLSDQEVWDKETELDYKKGVLVYEVSFEKNSTDYEYIINADSGEIVRAEVDPY